MRPIYARSWCARGYFAIAVIPERISRVVRTIETASGQISCDTKLLRRTIVRRFRHHRSKFLEARIAPERIEHWIEMEQRRSERYV